MLRREDCSEPGAWPKARGRPLTYTKGPGPDPGPSPGPPGPSKGPRGAKRRGKRRRRRWLPAVVHNPLHTHPSLTPASFSPPPRRPAPRPGHPPNPEASPKPQPSPFLPGSRGPFDLRGHRPGAWGLGPAGPCYVHNCPHAHLLNLRSPAQQPLTAAKPCLVPTPFDFLNELYVRNS